MTRTDFCLERLFRAARLAQEQPLEPSFGLETRVLAAFRRGLTDEELAWLPIVRKASVCACAIILVSLVLTFRSHSEPQPNELIFVDSAIQLTLMQ